MSRITHSQSALAVIATALLLGRCVAALELETCRITANEGRAEVKAQCGTLAVPLDPSAPDGERIELFVAVVPALAEEPAPDPFVVIAGGPGDASTRFFAQSKPRLRASCVSATCCLWTNAAAASRPRCIAPT